MAISLTKNSDCTQVCLTGLLDSNGDWIKPDEAYTLISYSVGFGYCDSIPGASEVESAGSSGLACTYLSVLKRITGTNVIIGYTDGTEEAVANTAMALVDPGMPAQIEALNGINGTVEIGIGTIIPGFYAIRINQNTKEIAYFKYTDGGPPVQYTENFSKNCEDDACDYIALNTPYPGPAALGQGDDIVIKIDGVYYPLTTTLNIQTTGDHETIRAEIKALDVINGMVNVTAAGGGAINLYVYQNSVPVEQIFYNDGSGGVTGASLVESNCQTYNYGTIVYAPPPEVQPNGDLCIDPTYFGLNSDCPFDDGIIEATLKLSYTDGEGNTVTEFTTYCIYIDCGMACKLSDLLTNEDNSTCDTCDDYFEEEKAMLMSLEKAIGYAVDIGFCCTACEIFKYLNGIIDNEGKNCKDCG